MAWLSPVSMAALARSKGASQSGSGNGEARAPSRSATCAVSATTRSVTPWQALQRRGSRAIRMTRRGFVAARTCASAFETHSPPRCKTGSGTKRGQRSRAQQQIVVVDERWQRAVSPESLQS